MSVASESPVEHRQFTVVLRGASAAIFEENAGMLLEEPDSNGTRLKFLLRTRWRVFGEGKKLPGHLWIEVVGNAPEVEAAVSRFSRAALAFLPVLALAANAAISDSDFELAFESTPGATERAYIQHFVAQEGALLREARRIDPGGTAKLIDAIKKSVHWERVLRSANQYGLALQSWRFGYESLAVAHLWMAVEALTKAVIREEMRRRDLSTQAELAAVLGVNLKQLDGVIRRDVILKGDAECYSNSMDASNGLEHGYLGFDEIRTKSIKVRERMAKLVREAILDLVAIAPDAAQVLKAAPYDKPLGDQALHKVIRGHLVGAGDELAAPGQAYPFLVWTSNLAKAEPQAGGSVEVKVTDSMTAQLGPGITFRPKRHEVWRP